MPGNVMQSNNPALDPATLSGQGWTGSRSGVFTIQGAALKALVLLGIVVVAAIVLWAQLDKSQPNPAYIVPILVGAALGGLVLAIVTCFKPEWAIVTGPLYAACQGVVLGALSWVTERAYPGLVLHAVLLTAGVFFVMLALYATRIIQATPWLTRGIIAATGGIFLVYLASWILNLFGLQIPYLFTTGPIGILFSLFVVGIAAFNLIIDFDTIEKCAAGGAPSGLEWYAAFALMVTLVWLYIEIVNLLIKLRGSQN